jgi:hypothetical protein
MPLHAPAQPNPDRLSVLSDRAGTVDGDSN